MNRRTLLQFVFSLALGGFFSVATAGKPRQTRIAHRNDDVVFDQSGSFNSGAFVMGLLSSDQLAEMAKSAAKLRKNFGYRCTVTHSSRNKWKQKYARSLIDLWMASTDAKIHVFIVKESQQLDHSRSSEKLSRYADLVSRLIDVAHSEKLRGVRLVTQAHFKADQQAQFERLLASRNARLKSALHISESHSDILQLVDLVVGAIQADLKSNSAPVTNGIKCSLSGYLRKKLGVKTLDQALQHPRCSVTYV